MMQKIWKLRIGLTGRCQKEEARDGWKVSISTTH